MACSALSDVQLQSILNSSSIRTNRQAIEQYRSLMSCPNPESFPIPSSHLDRINAKFPLRGGSEPTDIGGGTGSGLGSLAAGMGIGALTNPAVGFLTTLTGGLGSVFQSLMGQQAELERSRIPEPNVGFYGALTATEGIGAQDSMGQLAMLAAAQPGLLLDQLRQISELRSEINTKTSLTGDLSIGLQDTLQKEAVYAQKYGFTMSDLGDLYIKLVEESGKFAMINEQTMQETVKTARMLDMTMPQFAKTISEFEKVGIGAKETVTALRDAGLRSISLGLSAKKITDDMNTNIGKLNEYGFQNGIKGLERMVQRANEFKLSMDAATKIADDVMDPDKALSLTANLQVLGGAIGDFNDPLKLMYMATNNVEGLQDALIGAASNLATYNTEQGRFEITGVNLRRAKEMASQLGMSLGELNKTAIAAAERSQAASALLANNVKVDETQMEFLTNLARMEGGEMKITIPKNVAETLEGPLKGQTTIALSQLDQANAEKLLAQQELLKDKTVEQINAEQLTYMQEMARDMSVVAAYFKYEMAQKLALPLYNDLRNYITGELGMSTEEFREKSIEKLGVSLGGQPVSARTIPQNQMTNESNTPTSTSSTQTINYNATFRSDPDSDRARRLWEEEMARNPRDFTNWR